ncbi:MAG: carboxypeptidase regulatory-like domain-containing protein [Candidatus Sericytochromatia bacterium]|nr:carboxypeptidase regulatory-like domain-containing protein [Candidatus Sericytochromatia bacterium]
MARLMAGLALLMTVSGLALGCNGDGLTAPAGGIAGRIDWDGKPAPGRMVTLFASTDGGTSFADTQQKAVSDRNGLYAFSGLKGGTYAVLYVADALPGSNEYLWWRSAPTAVGAVVPAFDVAYNDVIFPPVSAAIRPPVTLFWSAGRFTHRYRLGIYSAPNGTNVDSGNPTWRSDWVPELCLSISEDGTAMSGGGCQSLTLPKALAPGNYAWGVEVDGGARGFGSSKLRSLIVNAPF